MLHWGLGVALLVTGFAWNPALVPWGGGLALLGLLQALTQRNGFYDPDRLLAHALLGLVGVFLLSILGVGYKLVSMFTLTHGVDETALGLLLWTANLGLPGLLLGERLGYLLLLATYLLALYDTHRILKNRMKRPLDLGVQHYLAGLALVRRVAELHGGRAVYKRRGEGALFLLELPGEASGAWP
jgi:hypothetical protein